MPTSHYGQPRYRLIADELRRRIEAGSIPRGSLLPPESSLTAEFNASRGTIRQAIALLRHEGIAITEHGRGTQVAAFLPGEEPPRSIDLERIHREVPADAELAAIFGINIGATLVRDEAVAREGAEVESVTRTYRRPRGGP
ncbi:GntR family transcriptional regulator [Micromonospora sp. WMMA2032]|uniref:GntR family transcriptional regulator n=1 Tax=Micromonospora sp. WMMA2032 TaxID=2039870 RepID=UPI0012FE6B15